MEVRKLRKQVGGTVQVTVPPAYLQKLDLKAGDYVKLVLVSRGIMIRPAFEKKEAKRENKSPDASGLIDKED